MGDVIVSVYKRRVRASYSYEWVWKSTTARNNFMRQRINRQVPSATTNQLLISGIELPLLRVTGENQSGTQTTCFMRYKLNLYRAKKSDGIRHRVDWAGTGNDYPILGVDRDGIETVGYDDSNEYIQQNDTVDSTEKWTSNDFGSPTRGINSQRDNASIYSSTLISGGSMINYYARLNSGRNFPNSPRTLSFMANVGGTADENGVYNNSEQYVYTAELFFQRVPNPTTGDTSGDAFAFPSTEIAFEYEYDSGSGASYKTTSGSGTPASRISRFIPFLSFEINVFPYSQEYSIYTQSAPPNSVLDIVHKAIACSQRRYSDEDTAYVVADEWIEPLSRVKSIETFFTEKNLWEVFLILGNYVHAIPFLRFTKDDRLEINFRQLGHNQISNKKSTKLSLFNSHTLSDYICTLDSTVTNLLQLGNLVEEIAIPSTKSSERLVYNANCEINVSKPVLEVLSLKVGKKNAPNDLRDITRHVVPKEIYDTLANVPLLENSDTGAFDLNYKGMFVYFTLGTTKIDGLNYQSPFATGTSPIPLQGDYSIKKIIALAFNQANRGFSTTIKINDYFFVVQYRTKETARVISNRLDLRKYFLNNSKERIPVLSQFNNQTEKYIDSNRFGLNSYGRLTRTGNTQYTQDEYLISPLDKKNAGELYEIDGRLAYVARATHTVWQNHITSQILYSIDYNQLSNIIGIPSEPRYYEISEQSSVEREISINDTIQLGTKINQKNPYGDGMLSRAVLSAGGMKKIYDLMTSGGVFPKFVVTIFKSNQYRDAFLHPVASFATMNTITFEWNMEDNFGAGDMTKHRDGFAGNLLDNLVQIFDPSADKAYNTTKPIRYCDEYGRAEWLEFYIFGDLDYATVPNISNTLDPDNYDEGFQSLPRITRWDNLTGRRVIQTWINSLLFDKNLPATPQKALIENSFAISSKNSFKANAMYDSSGFVLRKDNRERIKCNYNISLITDSDRFIPCGNTFQNIDDTFRKNGNIEIVLLRKELNKFENGFVAIDDVIERLPFTKSFTYNENTMECYAVFPISQAVFAAGATNPLQRIETRAVALLDTADQQAGSSTLKVYLGRNVGDSDTQVMNPDTPPAYTDQNANDMSNYKFADWRLSFVSQNTFPRQDGINDKGGV